MLPGANRGEGQLGLHTRNLFMLVVTQTNRQPSYRAGSEDKQKLHVKGLAGRCLRLEGGNAELGESRSGQRRVDSAATDHRLN